MIAKFKFTCSVTGKQLNIEHTTGKVNKFFLREVYLDNTSDVGFTQMFMTVGGTDYDLTKVSNLILYTNNGSVLALSRHTYGWEINGVKISDMELIDKLNELYVNENKKVG